MKTKALYFLIVLVALVFLVFPLPGLAATPLAQISAVAGQALVVKAGQPRPAVQGMPLFDQDEVNTTPEGSLEIKFADCGLVRLWPKTSVSLRRQGKQVELTVEAGKVLVQIKSCPGIENFLILSGNVTATLTGEGEAEFFADPLSGNISVGCASGQVLVEVLVGTRTAKVNLTPLTMTVITPGGLPGSLQPYQPSPPPVIAEKAQGGADIPAEKPAEPEKLDVTPSSF